MWVIQNMNSILCCIAFATSHGAVSPPSASPIAVSILQAAGGDAEYTSLMMEALPQELKLSPQLTD
jgi:hypothetical protein